MKKLELELLQHHCFMPIFAVPVSILDDGEVAEAKVEISSGKIYMVQSEGFSFWFVPNESTPWIKAEEENVSIAEILRGAAKALSECQVPAITYLERCEGLSESDQVNLLKPEFWVEVRAFVEKALCSLNKS